MNTSHKLRYKETEVELQSAILDLLELKPLSKITLVGV